MKDPHTIIIRPHITEKSVAQSYGDPMILDETLIQHAYTFVVAKDANKIEIKNAVETIYNAGKKDKDDHIKVEKVRTIKVRGKMRRVSSRTRGRAAGFKKAVVALARGQVLEDYGV